MRATGFAVVREEKDHEDNMSVGHIVGLCIAVAIVIGWFIVWMMHLIGLVYG